MKSKLPCLSPAVLFTAFMGGLEETSLASEIHGTMNGTATIWHHHPGTSTDFCLATLYANFQPGSFHSFHLIMNISTHSLTYMYHFALTVFETSHSRTQMYASQHPRRTPADTIGHNLLSIHLRLRPASVHKCPPASVDWLPKVSFNQLTSTNTSLETSAGFQMQAPPAFTRQPLPVSIKFITIDFSHLRTMDIGRLQAGIPPSELAPWEDYSPRVALRGMFLGASQYSRIRPDGISVHLFLCNPHKSQPRDLLCPSAAYNFQQRKNNLFGNIRRTLAFPPSLHRPLPAETTNLNGGRGGRAARRAEGINGGGACARKQLKSAVMTGRARVKARGQILSEEELTFGQPGSMQPSCSGSGDSFALQKETSSGNSPPKYGFSVGSSGYKVMDRGGRIRCNFQDMGVNTRETIKHVKDSKTGSSGIPVKLVTNLFSLGLPREWQLYQYHVEFMPELVSRRLRTALLYGHAELQGKTKVFDGASLFLTEKLENKVTELSCVTRRDETVKMTITLTHQLFPSNPVCIQFLNIVFKKVLKKLSMHQIGRNFYSPSDPVEIPQHKLTLWPGFAVTIGQFEDKVMLCADVSHKVLRNENVLEFMMNLYGSVDNSRFAETCEKELVGLIVLTRYNNKTYRIDDIEWTVKPTDTFQKSDGTQISYIDYYKQQYDAVLTDLNQPMLVSQLKGKGRSTVGPRVAHLIPELCYLTGLSSRATSDFRLMKDLAQETHLAPDRRHQRLSRLADNIQRNKDARLELESWGLKLGCQATLTGRVVTSEKILMLNEVCMPMNANDWFRDMRNMKMIGVAHLQSWIMLCSSRNSELAHSLMNCLRRVGGPMGFHIEYPKVIPVQESPSAFIRALQQYVTPELQLVLCVLPSNKKDCYDAVKKFLSFERPIPSQCVLARTLSKQGMMMSVATKIAMQITCKLGGAPWAVEIPLKSVMVVGIDVSKDALTKGSSVIGFVASSNLQLTRWYSRCMLQNSGSNTADCLKVCMKDALSNWQTCNGQLPERIIVYRDGVGDGQLRMVVNFEVPQILSALDESSGGCRRAKLSVVVVRKKCLNRFFIETNRSLQNPPVGTVIDTEATRPEWYDFFLISQLARQGTVNPTYYNVVYDENGFKPDHMQRFTYKMCHLYYNWPGLIRVPAPCQYASKLTFLVGQSIHREPNLALANKLFYL